MHFITYVGLALIWKQIKDFHDQNNFQTINKRNTRRSVHKHHISWEESLKISTLYIKGVHNMKITIEIQKITELIARFVWAVFS